MIDGIYCVHVLKQIFLRLDGRKCIQLIKSSVLIPKGFVLYVLHVVTITVVIISP